MTPVLIRLTIGRQCKQRASKEGRAAAKIAPVTIDTRIGMSPATEDNRGLIMQSMNESEMVTAQDPVRPGLQAGPVQHAHHWSIYLVLASACLLVAGLASDPKLVETVRSLLALR
jgi:hypothetical protein